MLNNTPAALTPILLLLALCVSLPQVTADDGPNADKRQVSVMARDGQLPYEGKRYVGEKLPEQEQTGNAGQIWVPAADLPSVYLMAKRYVGALAKSGGLRFKQQDDKRDDVDTMIDELLTAEELKKIRLEALRDELLREEEVEAEKKSLSSLARSGSLPSKRSVAAVARAGYLKPIGGVQTDDYGKRGIYSLARNGELSSPGKRGGISSLMRNGKRFDYDSDGLVDEYDMDDKRNIASLARGYNLPSMGKKNIASFARNGWLRESGPNSKKSYFDWEDDLDEEKRNIPSLLKNRFAGKRYLGAFIASNRLPYGNQDYDDEKRNVGSMARNFNLPQRHVYGKRDWLNIDNAIFGKSFEDEDVDENQSFDDEEDWNNENMQKRHIGSLLAQKSFAMRKKKSISLEDQFAAPFSTPSSTTKPPTDENKMQNEIQQNHRLKRDAFAELDDYSAQNDDVAEEGPYGGSRALEDQNARQKRYFGALARSGWLPADHYRANRPAKRHIGALARMGWLPSFRSVRAYNRFGRDTRSPCKRAEPPLSSEGWREDPGREAAARGEVSLQQPQLWPTSPLGYRPNRDDDDDDDDVEMEERERDPVKRFLLIPALDNILLRRQPINWIH